MRSLVSVAAFSVPVLVLACSSSVEPGSSAGKKKPAAAVAPATPSSAYAAAPTASAPPPVTPPPADAGVRKDAGASIKKPDGTPPKLPGAAQACTDLGRCCQKIQSSIERAACMAVVYGAKPSTCATAVIGYQLLGCGHAPFSFGSGGSNDDDGDGTPDFVDPDGTADVTLEEYCVEYPSDDACSLVSSGGSSGYDSDPCLTNPASFECSDDPFGSSDPDFGDPYGGDPYGGDPYGGDPYGGDPSGGDDGSGDDGSGGFFDP